MGDYRYPTRVVEEGTYYVTVAAGQTGAVLGGPQTGSGAVGDLLSKVTIVPASATPNYVSLSDGTGTPFTIYNGGTGVANNQSWTLELNYTSRNGAWKINTGTGLSVVAAGIFT